MSRFSDTEPSHYRRYRVAWEAYIDPDTPDACRLDLENEMDSAQNEFTFDEFQEFKKTLPGFVRFWQELHDGGLAALDKL